MPESCVVPFYDIIYTLGTLFAVPLIAYGILRHSLLTLDLRIRSYSARGRLARRLVPCANKGDQIQFGRFKPDLIGNQVQD